MEKTKSIKPVETYTEKKARLEKERKENNAAVIKSYRIDTKANPIKGNK